MIVARTSLDSEHTEVDGKAPESVQFIPAVNLHDLSDTYADTTQTSDGFTRDEAQEFDPTKADVAFSDTSVELPREALESIDPEEVTVAEPRRSVPPPVPSRPSVSRSAPPPPPSRPATATRHASIRRATPGATPGAIVSPDEVIAYVRDSSPPPPAHVALPAVTSGPSRRLTISDPLDIIFGMVHEFEFLQDSLDGSECCLRAALAAIPSRAGLVHLYDAARREFVVAAGFGDKHEQLVGRRVQGTDHLLARATQARRPASFTLASTLAEGIKFTERHMHFGWPDVVVVVPVFSGSKLVGAIELIDPDTAKVDLASAALTYLAERFATYLEFHPLVFPVPAPHASGTICYHCLDGVHHECRLDTLRATA